MAENDYIELATLKSTLELSSETFADSDLEAAITAASRGIDEACQRRFYADAEAQTRNYRPGDTGKMLIDDLISLTSLTIDVGETGEEEWTEDEQFELRPLNASVEGRPYWQVVTLEGNKLVGKVAVKGKWGWPEVPPQIEEATSIVATKLVKRKREAPFGITGVGLDGAAVRISSNDPDVRFLLEPFVLVLAG